MACQCDVLGTCVVDISGSYLLLLLLSTGQARQSCDLFPIDSVLLTCHNGRWQLMKMVSRKKRSPFLLCLSQLDATPALIISSRGSSHQLIISRSYRMATNDDAPCQSGAIDKKSNSSHHQVIIIIIVDDRI